MLQNYMATKQILYIAYFPLLGKRTQDANFFDTAQALEDRRAVVNESLRGDQMVLFTNTCGPCPRRFHSVPTSG